LVHVRDEGATFDAPVDVVWQYLTSGPTHAEAHKLIRNRTQQPAGENAVIATMERNWNGEWIKVVSRMTRLPPLGVVQEFLEGPFAGSKAMLVYTPQGAKTRVDVFGEFTSPTIPAKDVEKAALKWLEQSYDEDAPAVKAFASRK
jgi:hypothetical protein